MAESLGRELQGAPVEGVLGGRGWLSLRIGGRFLWFVALGGLRAAWLDTRAVPAPTVEALGRHQRSPFAPLLQGQVTRGLRALVDDRGEAVCLRLEFESGRSLGARFWPRPGAVWIEEADGRLASVSPPDAQDCAVGLQAPTDPPASSPWTPEEAHAHSVVCRGALEKHLETAALKRLRDATRGARRKAERLGEALARENEEARRESELRARADLLAAHLHRVPKGVAQLELPDFEGQPVVLRLDPALSPAENLEKIYRRAGRAERKLAQLERRRSESSRRIEEARRAEQAVREVEGLEAILQLARELEVDLRPRAPGEHRSRRKQRATRLPYRVFVLATQREVWVGRGARDNDELTFRHAAPLDFWFHAGGVEGSHVVLRHLGQDPSPAEQEAAAQLAALFSKAKGATTVPVWMTRRRHVRKPRKAPPGAVAPERVSTLFVEPREPAGHWLRQDD